MEINTTQRPKNLHHHALPIVILAIVFLAIATPYLLRQNTLSGNGPALIHDLSTRTLEVSPTSNGFAHITLNKQPSEQISPEVAQAGRTAEFMFIMDQLNSSTRP
jgi:hypothetical protein